jgi:hypothetical protein
VTLGEIILAEGLHDWGMRAVPLFSYTLAFALQLRKSTENLSQGSYCFTTDTKVFNRICTSLMTLQMVQLENRTARDYYNFAGIHTKYLVI